MVVDQLAELKRLLFEQEQESIERLESRIELPTTRARDVAEVLAESFNLNQDDDGDLAVAMRSTVNQCISDSVRSDPDTFADALFPVIGPAIRKAVAESIAALSERINQALDNSFSKRALKWRFESMRTGVPLSEIIFRETLIYRVEEAFVIQRHSGLLVAHAAGEAVVSQDSDAVSAMLTAIENFVRDSFKSDEQSVIDTITVGGKTVWLFHGPKATIAGVIRGNPPNDLREKFYRVNEEVHARFGDLIVDFSGDRNRTEGLTLLLLPLVESQSLKETTAKPEAKFRLNPLVVILGILILLVLVVLFFDYRQSNNRDRLIDTLNNISGIEVLDYRKSGGAIRIRALRDPLASIAPDIVTAHGFDEQDVVIDLIPFHSLDAETVLRRATQILKPPPTVSLALRDNVLVVSGRATGEWTTTARNFPLGVGGIEDLDFSALGPDIEALIALARQSLKIPGSVVVEIENGQLIGHGTAPLTWLENVAGTKVQIGSINKFDFDNVAANAASILERIRDNVTIPNTAHLQYAKRQLILSGSAPYAWYQNLRAMAIQAPYIDGVEDDGFTVAERLELDSLIGTNRDFLVLFSNGVTLTPDSRSTMERFTPVLDRLVALDGILENVSVGFSVSAHTDRTGTDEQNQAMRNKRAQTVAKRLIDRGVDRSRITFGDSASDVEDHVGMQSRSAEIRISLITN